MPDHHSRGQNLSDFPELERIRYETPGTQYRTHLNNAGAALMPLPVVETIKTHLNLEAEIGGYEAANGESSRIADVYASVARLLNAHRDEVALFGNATLAWQNAFYALPFKAGDRILTARAEYAANLVAYKSVSERTGAVVEIIPDRANGETDPQALEAMLDERVKLVSITWIPTNGALINPVADIGHLTRRHGIPFMVDACQAAGQLPIDVEAIGCDMLTAAGRKFLRGPRGTGFLYIRRALRDRLTPVMIDHFAAPWTEDGYALRPDARRFETWETNVAAQLGLGSAVDYALAIGLDRIAQRCTELADLLRAELARISRVTPCDLGADKAAIVSIAIAGASAEHVRDVLAAQNINVHVSKSGGTPLDTKSRNLPSLLRISPHYYNSEDEIGRCLDALRAALP